ncbi:hypothetical protein CCYA_CCYA02G0753 [Cyanidiococcus yangmingshanensis]|nr:hypothetical protein CCYA_CCYA02G0753 [Cyanidiococcus yangmingshanensis]
MASGLSVRGGEGRCYSFWLAFKKCMLESSDRTACTAYREDYEECLHHRKAIKRFNTVVRELQRRETAGEKLPRPEEMSLEPSTWTEADHAADVVHERQAVAGSTETPQAMTP